MEQALSSLPSHNADAFTAERWNTGRGSLRPHMPQPTTSTTGAPLRPSRSLLPCPAGESMPKCSDKRIRKLPTRKQTTKSKSTGGPATNRSSGASSSRAGRKRSRATRDEPDPVEEPLPPRRSTRNSNRNVYVDDIDDNEDENDDDDSDFTS